MTGLVVLPRLLEPLELPGAEIAWYDDDAQPSGAAIADAGFFVPRYLGAPNASLAATMPNLQVVQLLTIGYEYALPYVPLGIALCNAQGVHEASTAELAVGLAIASLRRIDAAARDMTAQRWDHQRGASLQGKHVVVIGAGPVGSLVAERFRPMCREVTVVARHARAGIVSSAELPMLLPQADIVVLAVPLTDETTRMVDGAFLASMRDGALLINVARGAVVETEALVRVLTTGRIRAALDVTDPEPLPAGHPLWSLPNVLVTPHVGGDTDAFPVLARALIAAQVAAWRVGRPLANVVRLS